MTDDNLPSVAGELAEMTRQLDAAELRIRLLEDVRDSAKQQATNYMGLYDDEREKVRVLRDALQVIQADARMTIGEVVGMGRLSAKLICCESTARNTLAATEPKEKP